MAYLVRDRGERGGSESWELGLERGTLGGSGGKAVYGASAGCRAGETGGQEGNVSRKTGRGTEHV